MPPKSNGLAFLLVSLDRSTASHRFGSMPSESPSGPRLALTHRAVPISIAAISIWVPWIVPVSSMVALRVRGSTEPAPVSVLPTAESVRSYP